MKIGCADGVCSHLNHILTASSADDSACPEQIHYFYIFIVGIEWGILWHELLSGEKDQEENEK